MQVCINVCSHTAVTVYVRIRSFIRGPVHSHVDSSPLCTNDSIDTFVLFASFIDDERGQRPKRWMLPSQLGRLAWLIFLFLFSYGVL